MQRLGNSWIILPTALLSSLQALPYRSRGLGGAYFEVQNSSVIKSSLRVRAVSWHAHQARLISRFMTSRRAKYDAEQMKFMFTYLHIFLFIHLSVYPRTCIHIYIYMHTYIYIYTHVCICIYTGICLCVCTYTHVFLYTSVFYSCACTDREVNTCA